MLICSITTWGESLNKLIIGKCFSIQILENLPKKKYFQGKCKVIQLQKLQSHPTISLDNIQVETASYVKHLGILLDEKLNFKQHIECVILKINKDISVLTKLRYSLSRKSSLTICKAFLRPLVDYGDIIYDQTQVKKMV